MMKCLSIQQPWAWAIMAGIKPVENRLWSTSYRGPLLVHASRSKVSLSARHHWPTPLPELTPDIESKLVFGAILGVVTLKAILPAAQLKRGVAGELVRGKVVPASIESRWTRFAEGPWCWILTDPLLFREPIPFRGQPGLFDVEEEIYVRAYGAALKEAAQ